MNASRSKYIGRYVRYRLCYFSLHCGSFNMAPKAEKANRETLVILGTGWGGYSVLKNVDKYYYDVIVVSRRNHFLFTPLLASTTVGTLEFRSIIEPVRNLRFRHREHFHLSYATGVDFTKRQVHCESVLKPGHHYSLSYDKLVISIGSLSSTLGVPGVKEHSFFLKELSDARLIRNQLLSNLELSVQPNLESSESERLRHVVIVGGGPTGVEFGAELYDFLEQDVSRLYNLSVGSCKVTLVESNKILSAFDQRLQAYAEKKIKQRLGFHLVTSTVKEVHQDSVTLEDDTVLPCGMAVWSTGLSPHPFIDTLDTPKDTRGSVLTDNRLRILAKPDGSVFALGDCAQIKDEPLPKTAQVAERQGEYIAEVLSGKHSRTFDFKSMGMLAYIGQYQGLTDLPEIKLIGVPSWFLWRSAYLTRLGNWRLRFQVPFDWTKTLIFGRDISRF